MSDEKQEPTLADLRQKPHFSYSALSLYLSCSLAYFFRYIQRVEAEHTSKNLLFGSAFHKTLDRLAAMRMAGMKLAVKDAQQIFLGEWKCQLASHINIDFESPEEAVDMGRQGQQMLEAYLGAWKDSKILAHSQAFSIDIAEDGKAMSRPVIGEYDMVIEEEGKSVIVDFKTAGRRWDADKPHKDAQATLYCLSYWMATGTIPGFRFDVITKAKTPSVTQMATARTEDSFRRLARVFHGIDQAIKKEVFLPSETSFLCGCCEYASACKTWHRAEAATRN